MIVMLSSPLTGGFFTLFLFLTGSESSASGEEYYETRHRQFARRRDAEMAEQPRSNDRYRYRENAETEFKRPGYFPVPFVVGGITSAASRNNGGSGGGSGNGYGDLRTVPIPSMDLSALIRQHIAHQRHKLLGSQEGQLERYTPPPPTLGPLLEGVSRITELRQTPYRRFSDDSSAVAATTYAEKRRRWKTELKRRLRGPKVPARPIGDSAASSPTGNSPEDSMVISDGAADRRRVGGGTHRVGGGTDHYYVTYSPQARIYQVSRRPPPNLYANEDADHSAPASIGNRPQPTEEEVLETSAHRRPAEPQALPATTVSTTTTSSTTTITELPPFVQLEDDEMEVDGWGAAWPSAPPTARTYLVRPPPPATIITTAVPETTATTTTTTTTTAQPAVVVVQQAEPVVSPNYTRTEQIRVAPDAELTQIRFPVIKQILHLDDYYQELNDDDGAEDEDVADEDEREDRSNEKNDGIVKMPILSKGDLPTTSSTTTTTITTTTTTPNHTESRESEQSEKENEDQQQRQQQSAVDDRRMPIVYPANDATLRNQYVVPMAPRPAPTTTTTTPVPTREEERDRMVTTNDDDVEEEEDNEDDDDFFFWKSERPSSGLTRRSNNNNNNRPSASSAASASSRSRDDPFQIVVHEDDT